MNKVVWTVHWKKSGKMVQGSHGKKYYETESGAKKRCQQGCGLMEVREQIVIPSIRYAQLVNTEHCMSSLGLDKAYNYTYDLKSEEIEDE